MKLSKDINIIWKYLSKYKKQVYIAVFLAVTASIISALIPYLYGKLVDIAISGVNYRLIITILIFWLIVSVFRDWLEKVMYNISVYLSVDTSNDMLLELGSHVMELPLSFHKEKKFGKINRRIMRASEYLERIIDEVVFDFLPLLITLVIILIIMFFVKLELALLVLGVLVVYGFASLHFIRQVISQQKKVNLAFEHSYGHLFDAFRNIQVIKSNTAETIELKKMSRNFKGRAAKAYKGLFMIFNRMNFWQSTIFSIAFVAVFGLSILFLYKGQMSPGKLVTFVGYLSMIYRPVGMLAHSYRVLKDGMTVIERALSLLKIPREKFDIASHKKYDELRGAVKFDRVSFSYIGKRKVLDKISFSIKPGTVVAIVGESGVGKTTLVDLISRYYKPASGVIYIDGEDSQKIDLRFLRSQIAIVPQEISLFNDTIARNIRYGRINATDEEVIAASKASNCHEFIKKFPKKYKQLVGERGIKLSTGQKQRVAIAQAILRDPKILILDEATSSLDSVSEQLVHKALEKLIKGRTTFIIAHRLSTIKHADRILVLEKGKIVESGNHKSLLRKNGVYRKFFDMQSKK